MGTEKGPKQALLFIFPHICYLGNKRARPLSLTRTPHFTTQYKKRAMHLSHLRVCSPALPGCAAKSPARVKSASLDYRLAGLFLRYPAAQTVGDNDREILNHHQGKHHSILTWTCFLHRRFSNAIALREQTLPCHT